MHMPPRQAAAAASEIVAHCRGTEPRHKPWHGAEPHRRGTEPNQTAVVQNRVR